MRVFGLAALLLLQLGITHADDGVFTLGEVEAQIESYLEQNDPRSLPHLGCVIACGFLAFTKPKQLSYADSPTYQFLGSQYWSQQQALTEPICRFSPASPEDVSLAVLTLRVTKCQFAVKSGGHAAFAGASNIEGGVTIDLVNLKKISVSADKKRTSIGAGNVWYDVYKNLTPKGLTVIGGRVSAIGAGGLTLGGGISFVSARYGWACDNVNTYQVVLADGSIREVSYKSPYSDLYWALRGGGNNFGIVTRLDLATYPQGYMWAGAQTFPYSDETTATINNAFYHLSINSPKDPYAQVIIAYAYAQQVGSYIIASDLQYGKPTPYPPILKNFTDIHGAVADSLRIVDLPSLTIEFNNTNPGGFRQSYWTYTVANSDTLMNELVAIWKEEVDNVKDAEGIVPSIVYQPITTDMTKYFTKNGGNPLGLAGQGPLNLANIVFSWSDAVDDNRILVAAQNIVNRSVVAAKKKGLDNSFLYQNYASQQQKVFASYGKDNLAKLRSISAKYDPQQVWQKLQPGYFKLD